MSKKQFAIVETDFMLGIDQKDFTSLPISVRGVYISLWVWCWIYSTEGKVTPEKLRRAAKLLEVDKRTLVNSLEKCCKKRIVQKDGEGYILLGMEGLRAKYYKKKVGKKSADDRDGIGENENKGGGDIEGDIEIEGEIDIDDIPVLDLLAQDPDKMKTPALRLALRFMRDVSGSFSRSKKGRMTCIHKMVELLENHTEAEIKEAIGNAPKSSAPWDLKITPNNDDFISELVKEAGL